MDLFLCFFLKRVVQVLELLISGELRCWSEIDINFLTSSRTCVNLLLRQRWVKREWVVLIGREVFGKLRVVNKSTHMHRQDTYDIEDMFAWFGSHFRPEARPAYQLSY